jgi:hypothetical protein
MPKPRGRTGPTTEQGKQIASRNAAKHNCTSKSLIVPGEIQSEFDALLASLIAEYQPATEMQQIRVEEAARATWELRRAHREFDKSQVRLYGEQPNMCDWTPKQQAELDRMSRYRTRAERAYHRALQSIECLRTMRLRAEQRAFWENLQEAQLDLSERRLQLAHLKLASTTKQQKLEEKAPEHQQPEQHIPAQRPPQTAHPPHRSAHASPAPPSLRTCTQDEFLAFVSNFQERQIPNREKLLSQDLPAGPLSGGSMATARLNVHPIVTVIDSVLDYPNTQLK